MEGLDVHPRAKRNVGERYKWLASRSPKGARAWYQALSRALDRILYSPESYPIAPEFQSWERLIREAIFKTRSGRNYRILFEIRGERVTVLRVRMPGQRPLRRRDIPKV